MRRFAGRRIGAAPAFSLSLGGEPSTEDKEEDPFFGHRGRVSSGLPQLLPCCSGCFVTRFDPSLGSPR